jgi:hypothetical protein
MNRCVRMSQVVLSLVVLTSLSALVCKVASSQSAGNTGAGSQISGPLAMLPEYQAREPRKCSTVKTPPSVSQAAIMVQCSMDGLAPTGLTLIQDVKIEMGSPRPFVYRTDAGLAGIDLNAQVYPLRGSYTNYSCLKVGAPLVPPGHSCIRSAIPESMGWCWKSSFGDFKCTMHGGATPKMEQGMPAPTTY